jgi:Predicted Zn-dependent protease
MRKILSAAIALLVIGSLSAQSQKFSYNALLYYRTNLYLQTPSVFLSFAANRALVGDTLEAIHFLKLAVTKGMYDTEYITSDTRLNFVTKTSTWPNIRKIILHNRSIYSEPGNMQIITGDIDNFWKVFDKMDKPKADSIIMKEYILKGSQGLRTFFENRMNSRPTAILDMMRKKKKYLQDIRPVSLSLYKYRSGLTAAAKKLKELYPPAIFPPTYFTIGIFSAFGTSDGGAGQLIGAEFLCDTNHINTTELNGWERSVITDSSRVSGIVIHELMHIQQKYSSIKTLLDKALNEGAADFVSQLVLNNNLNSRIHEYGNAHEAELWQRFSKEMDKDDVSYWLYNGFDANRKVPADLGYYMGYKICERYYDNAVNKKQAIKDILEIKNFKAFLESSKYSEKFK